MLIERGKLLLTNERLILREFEKDDWMDVHQYASQEIVCQYQSWGPNSEGESKAFVDKIIKDAIQSPRIRFAFAIDFNGHMIGAGELNVRDETNGEISYIINPNYWGKGFATEVANSLIDFGYKELKLHRIYATCNPRNIGSLRVLEKVGMTQEGRLRENVLIKDGYRDSYVYSMLKHEWGRKRN